jgi:polyisoprenoid-binding protein YceI
MIRISNILKAGALFACLMVFAICPVQGQSFFSDEGHVEFTSNVPLHSFTGESEQLTGRLDLAENTVDFYVDLSTLDTGNGKRDKDMRSTLETEEFPFAEFFGSFVSLPDPEGPSSQDVEVEGEFTIHGVTRMVRVPGTVTFTAEGVRVKASWTLQLDDYDIEPPRLLIFKVDEEQVVSIDMLLNPE